MVRIVGSCWWDEIVWVSASIKVRRRGSSIIRVNLSNWWRVEEHHPVSLVLETLSYTMTLMKYDEGEEFLNRLPLIYPQTEEVFVWKVALVPDTPSMLSWSVRGHEKQTSLPEPLLPCGVRCVINSLPYILNLSLVHVRIQLDRIASIKFTIFPMHFFFFYVFPWKTKSGEP